ncbi:hypothetical protein [Enterococcus durans]|uniref:hypothetical protein n=1 Tax=Enterococcus durans TaxID=53345 RepID=UPI0035659BD4
MNKRIGFIENLFVFRIDDDLFNNFTNVIASIYIYPKGARKRISTSNLSMYTEKMQQQIEYQIYLEEELLNYREDFMGVVLISQIIFFEPIVCSERELIIPTIYVFNDKRGILKFKTILNEKDCSLLDGKVNFNLENVSFKKKDKKVKFNFNKYRKRENGINITRSITELYIKRKSIDFFDMCNLYLNELDCINEQSSLVTNYINIIFTNREIKTTNDKKFMKRIARSPFPDSVKNIDDLISFNGCLLFASSKKIVCAPDRYLMQKFNEIEEKDRGGLAQNDYNYICLSGNYQLILETLLLKWFKTVYLSTNLKISEEITIQMEEKLKLNSIYTNTENIIVFSKYESITTLYSRLAKYFFPKEIMDLMTEQSKMSNSYSDYLQQKRLNNISIKFTIMSIILTVLFSYEPILKILNAIGYKGNVLFIYVIFNLIVASTLVKSYKK